MKFLVNGGKLIFFKDVNTSIINNDETGISKSNKMKILFRVNLSTN